MKKLSVLLSIIFCFLFISVEATDGDKSKSYKCKHIGIQKIKKKKFRKQDDNKKKSKDKYETIKNTCIYIPVKSPRYTY